MSNRTTRRPLYYLVTAAGVPNYGDELISMCWLRHLADVAPDADVVVDCIRPDRAAARLRGVHPNVRLVRTLWQLCIDNWSTRADSLSEQVARAVAEMPPAGESPGGALLEADVVHLAGGGFINGIWPAFSGLLAGITAATGRSGGLAAMTGQGFWPPAAGFERLLPALASRFDIVDVRDDPSADLVASAGPSCTGDDALLGPCLPGDPGGQAPSMMVSVQSLHADAEPEDVLDFVANVMRAWDAPDLGIIESAPEQDRDILELAEQMLPVARRYALDDLLANGMPARPGQCWLATRFHAHLMAACAGASGVAVSVRPDYYPVKHRSLIERGSRWEMIETLDEVPARPTGGGFAPGELDALRASKLSLARRIYAPAPRRQAQPAEPSPLARPERFGEQAKIV